MLEQDDRDFISNEISVQLESWADGIEKHLEGFIRDVILDKLYDLEERVDETKSVANEVLDQQLEPEVVEDFIWDVRNGRIAKAS